MNSKVLKHLIDTGYSVLVVRDEEDKEGKPIVWLANRFEPAMPTSSNPNNFNIIEGIEVTDFVNTTNFQNKSDYNRLLLAFIDNNTPLTMKFSSNFKWRLYVR